MPRNPFEYLRHHCQWQNCLRHTFRLVGQEVVYLLDSSVVGNYVEPLVVHVQNQVLALQKDAKNSGNRDSTASQDVLP